MEAYSPVEMLSTPDEELGKQNGDPLGHRFDPAQYRGQERGWLVEGLLAEGQQVTLYSPPKVGKSIFSYELAVALSKRDSFLGAAIPKVRKVLYVDYENDYFDIANRFYGRGEDAEQMLKGVYLPAKRLSPLNTTAGLTELLFCLDRFSPDLVIVDTVSKAVVGDENDSAVWQHFFRNVSVPLRERGIGLLRLDHSGKDTTRGIRGSSAKSADSDATWKLEVTHVWESDSGAFPPGTAAMRLVVEQSRIRISKETYDFSRDPEGRIR